MRALWLTDGWRGGGEPPVGRAVRLRALGAEARAWPPRGPAAPKEWTGPVTTGVTTPGRWR